MSANMDLRGAVARVKAASDRVADAQKQLAQDKVGRKRSFLARVVDALMTTKPEAAMRDAQQELDQATKEGLAAARTWVVATARQSLANNDEDALRHEAQGQKLGWARGRAERTALWLSLARAADRELTRASTECRDASDLELLDAISSNKGISALSYVGTSDAADAVQRAKRAVQALADALPKRAQPALIDTPDDTLDLVIDFSFDLGFDILSWFNMDKLDDAADQCDQVAAKLRPLLKRLQGIANKAQAKVEQEAAALLAIEQPYFDAAQALVPPALRETPQPVMGGGDPEFQSVLV